MLKSLRLKDYSKSPQTLGEQMLDLANRIREVFKVGRVTRLDGKCGGYVHHAGTTVGVLVEVTGGNPEAAKDVCMHIAAMKPLVLAKEDLDPAVVEKEREIFTESTRKEGKPENIIPKMIEGRLKQYFAEKVLLEQPFVKDDKLTIGKVAEGAKMKVLRFQRWETGK